MKHVFVCFEYNSFTPYRPSDGVSDEARKIHEISVNSFSSFYEAFSLSLSMEHAYDIVNEIYDECGEPDWDGYDAAPVCEDALTDALKLIRMLPSAIPMPIIAPQPNGGLTLRWRKGKAKTLVLAVSGDDRVNFAAILGGETRHGSVRFSDFLPKTIPAMLLEADI